MPDILVVVILAILLFGCLVLFIIRRSSTRYSRQEIVFFQKRWQVIEHEKNSTIALLEADKLLDLALKKKGYGGSMGEKLKKAGYLFSDIDAIWRAHKLRNRIAHEMNVKVSDLEVRKTLYAFRRGLHDIKALP